MPELLAIDRLRAGYGEALVLSDISLSLQEGQALALLGRNGMGKTTLINTIVGVTRYLGGRIALDGADITRLRPDQRAHAGIGWVPQERNIFKSLTVEENLTAVARPGRWTVDKVYVLFPRLAERRQNLGNQLSGGEQQMLAVARALVLNPRVMLLDEPLEGVPDGSALTGAQMQAIAGEFNLAETTFVLPPQDPAHTAQVRIFTPRAELPFAGHPNIGTAFVLANENATQGRALTETMIFEEKAGLVRLSLVTEAAAVVGARLVPPQPLSRGEAIDAETIAAACSLAASDIERGNHP